MLNGTKQANESIGILIDPRHEGVDLHGGPENYRTASGFNARAMREDRPAQQGLLLLYPKDPEPLRAPTQAVLGLALSLPRTTDGEQRFVLNRGGGAMSEVEQECWVHLREQRSPHEDIYEAIAEDFEDALIGVSADGRLHLLLALDVIPQSLPPDLQSLQVRIQEGGKIWMDVSAGSHHAKTRCT